MEQDYTIELVTKWSSSGHLMGIQADDSVKVAQRLEAAFRRTMGVRGDFYAIERELEALRREGFYGSVNSSKDRHKIRG